MPSSTWKNRNIFEDVLNRENALTDTLRNFLKYPPVRDALWQTLPIPKNVRKRVNFSLIEAIETRPSHSRDLGEPDLVLYGSDFILVIEVKVKQDRDLTDDHQQEAYVSWIKREIRDPRKEMGFVVFLIPDDYHHSDLLDSCIEQARTRLCSSNNSNIQILDSIKWKTLIKAFESQDMPSLNELTREFYDYLDEKFIPKPVRFSAEEVRLMNDKKTARGVLKLMAIVNEKVKPKLNEFRSKFDSADYGYEFFSPEETKSLYFGIWWKFWAATDFPLCIAIWNQSPQSMLESFQKKYKDRFRRFENGNSELWVVGFKLDSDTDCMIENIVTDIGYLLREDDSDSSEDAETP